MHPAPTGRIDDTGIIAIRNRRNCMYLVEADVGYILIDAGSVPSEVKTEMETLGISPESVSHVFLTHSDYDHTASLQVFGNAVIHISEDETRMVNGTARRSAIRYNKLPNGVKVDAFTALADGEERCAAGRHIKCIKAPGHTPGSMTYLIDGKYLFTGDAFLVRNGAMLVHPFTMDAIKAQESFKILSCIIKDCELVLTAHYGYFRYKTKNGSPALKPCSGAL
jgi:glyoxylase-like metal-dependent hydrolase (beta-lactamase superfamily II)